MCKAGFCAVSSSVHHRCTLSLLDPRVHTQLLWRPCRTRIDFRQPPSPPAALSSTCPTRTNHSELAVEASKGMKGGVGWFSAQVAASGHCPLAAGNPEMLSRGRMMPGAAETPPPPSPHRCADFGKLASTWHEGREPKVSSPHPRAALTCLPRCTFLIWTVLVPGATQAAAGQAASTKQATCKGMAMHMHTLSL
jgi:hypothetical protein